jgi:hypothetical protein
LRELLDGNGFLIEEILPFFIHGDGRAVLSLLGRARSRHGKVHGDALVLDHGHRNHHEGGKQEEDDVDQRDDLDARPLLRAWGWNDHASAVSSVWNAQFGVRFTR